MNWLQNILSSKPKKNEDPQIDKDILLEDYLDKEFIDALYFKDAAAKDDYINMVKNVISINTINQKLERIKVADYFTNNDIDIPFLLDAIKFDNYNGNFKLNKYYTALNVCRFNIEGKIENHITNFEFEEGLVNKALKDDYRNYAKIDTLFRLGQAFGKVNNLMKMDFYFDLIFKDPYELSESTVANFHRKVGDTYLEIGNKELALKWFKSGLSLNPKLGVKKLIVNLEKELNMS